MTGPMVVAAVAILIGLDLVVEARKLYWKHRLRMARNELAEAKRAADASKERLLFARARKAEFDLAYNPNRGSHGGSDA